MAGGGGTHPETAGRSRPGIHGENRKTDPEFSEAIYVWRSGISDLEDHNLGWDL